MDCWAVCSAKNSTVHVTDETLSARLIALAAQDASVRAALAASGALFDGYHPEMQAVHEANAIALDALLDGRWPPVAEVGENALEAAWIVVQHAISLPVFQRRYLDVIKMSVAQGQAPAWQAAMLEDRIRCFEGRPQVYGTQFDWDEAGQLSPSPLEDADGVDARRAGVGLGSLSDAIVNQRARAVREGNRPPNDFAQRQAAFEDWARKAGWRS